MTIFDQAHPKITESTFSFPEFVPANNQFIPSVHFWDKGQSESSLTSLATLIFEHTHQKIFGQLLILWICINMQKISYCICSFYLSVNSMCLYICSFSYSNCSVTSLAKPIFDYTHPCICSFYLLIPYFHISVHLVTPTAQSPVWLNPFSTMPTLKKLQAPFNSCEFVSTCKKWGCFIKMFWRNSWFENPAIWFNESILTYISGTKFFLV